MFIVPGDSALGIGFRNQCAHWWRKQFHKSVSRPEIPENFRLAQFFFLCAQKPPGGF